MRRELFPALLALILAAPAPALAGASGFTLVNGTSGAMSGVAIRRFGTDKWQQLSVMPSPGAKAPVDFQDQDCAFDIQATLPDGKNAVWTGINLCGAKVVTLNRDDSGAVWVDYD